MSFFPSPTSASNVPELRTWITNELFRLGNNFTIESQKTTVSVLYASPERPQTGQIVFADGSDWNPGSGRGLYYYDTNTWVHIA